MNVYFLTVFPPARLRVNVVNLWTHHGCLLCLLLRHIKIIIRLPFAISLLLGNSICVASDRLAAATAMMRLTTPTVGGKTTDSMDMLEYPFLTMTKYPMGFILHLGATVAARSVKLLERVPNPDEPEVRDSWWTELRMEIRSHARSLGCNVVLGYAESTTIS